MIWVAHFKRLLERDGEASCKKTCFCFFERGDSLQMAFGKGWEQQDVTDLFLVGGGLLEKLFGKGVGEEGCNKMCLFGGV